MSTKVDQFISDLDGGQLEAKLSKILSSVAGAVVDHGAAGEVTIKMDIKQIGNGCQVNVGHELKYVMPTMRGKVTETEKTSTAMHVGKGGAMSFYPEDQGSMFGKTGEVLENNFPNKA